MKKPTEDQIYEVIDFCLGQIDNGNSKYPGMSYEEGVEQALRWVLGQGESPFED